MGHLSRICARGAQTLLLLAMPLAAQQDVLVDEIDIFQFLNMETGSQFTGHFLPATDSLQDIGGSGASNRLRWGFADVWNGEQLEITGTTHLQHFSLEQDETGVNQEMDIKDPAGNEIMTFEAGWRVRLYEDIVPDSSVRGLVDNGTAADYWDEVWADNIIAIKGLHPSNPTISMSQNSQGGRLTIQTDNIFSPQARLSAYVNSVGAGQVDLYNQGFETVLEILADAGGGGTVIARGSGIGVGTGVFAVEDSSSQRMANLTHTINGGILTFLDPTSGLSAYWRILNGTTPGQMATNADVIPQAANLIDVGASGREWLNVYANFFQVRNSVATATILSGHGAAAGACSTGSIALNTAGGAGTTLYVCESGSWVGK